MTTDGLIDGAIAARPWEARHWPVPFDAASTELIVERLRSRLRTTVAAHGLSRRELIDVQRGVMRLQHIGLAPSGDDFWYSTALPRSRTFIERVRTVIDDELGVLIADVGYSWATTAIDGRPHGDVLEGVLPILPRSADLDELGWWWQRRLRRAAIRTAIPRLLRARTGDLSLVLARAEMQLLDQPPWAHGDRLLSAFELAYAEIERFGTARVLRARSEIDWAANGHLAIRL
ncbi:MAG: hypothetical protein AAGD35_03695 [Actinomycetota bacterium]